MAILIKNESQLNQIFKPALKQVVNYILDKILESNADIINKVVYDSNKPKLYNRTGEFAKAWNKSVTSSMNGVSGEFYYDWEKMSVGDTSPFAPDYAQHIGVVGEYEGKDSREYLAEIIYEGLAGPTFGNGYWTHKRDAFTKLVNHVGKTNFNNWFKQGCRIYGLKVSTISLVEPEKR